MGRPITLCSEVSIVLTVPLPWFTTKTNSPSALITAQNGCEPTEIVFTTVLSMVEIWVTVPLPWFTTKIWLLEELPAIITGSVPTGMEGVVTERTFPEITLTSLLSRLAIRIFPALLVVPAMALGSPEGGGMGVINWRKVSLQPTASSKTPTVQANTHNAAKRDFIKTPPVLPV